MDIVFFGSSSFSMPSLRVLLSSRHRVIALVTQPDRRKGRHLRLSPPPTKVLAASQGITVYQPEAASNPESIRYLKGLKPELFFVVSFGQILKKELLEVPRLYSINLHGSLLPKYRGAAPVNWALINGEEKTGVTVMRMSERMDAGDVMASEELAIDEEDTALTLSDRLADAGAKLLAETIDVVERGATHFERQDEALATYAPKLKKRDGLINWDEEPFKIRNLVRGLVPWPGAYAHCQGKTLKIMRAELGTLPQDAGGRLPGEVLGVVKDKGIIVKAGSGALVITHLQLEGKKVLQADAFLRGHRIRVGEVLA